MIRDAFLATAAESRDLIATRDVARQWDEPSALAQMTVGALAGHLARATLLVGSYLDPSDDERGRNGEHPGGLLTAPQYFVQVGVNDDLDGELNTSIRTRSAQEAASGREALLERLDAALDDLRTRLLAAAPDPVVTVFGGSRMLLDEYLVTRLVELVVHIDDLAASVGRTTPDLPPTATACAIGCLLEIARTRHGDLAVVRALSRRERDPIHALHVL